MQHNSPTILFAGPSLNETSRALIEAEGLQLASPVKKGDIAILLNQGYRGTLIIVDGLFYTQLAVRHLEIRKALEQGCRIFGLSSMGAIRAYEMRFMGMQGYGKVYEKFLEWDDFQDDEVSLLHGPEPDYFPVSEPLVHFRMCMEFWIKSGKIAPDEASIVLQKLKQMFFGDRTVYVFKQLIQQHTSLDPQLATKDFDRYRIKKTDLENFLRNRIWLSAS